MCDSLQKALPNDQPNPDPRGSYMFVGVAMFADQFMCAIEAITSKERTTVDATGHQTHVKVWNPTVANLTLMALGSSAPEILLAVIEVVTGDFYSGALGPSCIVGSAAFNLLAIIAICTVSIPKGAWGGRAGGQRRLGSSRARRQGRFAGSPSTGCT